MNPKKPFFLSFGPKYFFAVGGHIVRIRTVVRIWHRNRGISGTDFEANLCFLFVVFGPYEIVRTTDCGHEKRGKRRPYNNTFWHGKRGRFLWDRFGAMRYFPWLEMYICCCFVLSLSIIIRSLSLSRWVSPHWGFPWHLPKFLSVNGLLSTVFFRCIFCLAMCISAYGIF
jgi:hypothetical protein